jgi:hypothetical protein
MRIRGQRHGPVFRLLRSHPARGAFPPDDVGALPGAIGWMFAVLERAAEVGVHIGVLLCQYRKLLKISGFHFFRSLLKVSYLADIPETDFLGANCKWLCTKGIVSLGEGSIFLLTYVEKPIIINSFHKGRMG